MIVRKVWLLAAVKKVQWLLAWVERNRIELQRQSRVVRCAGFAAAAKEWGESGCMLAGHLPCRNGT